MLQHIVLEAEAGQLDTTDSDTSSSDFFTDALAMACRFLPDAQLRALVRKLVAAASLNGSLASLCLTGLGTHTLQLLQSYLDRTSDVQTVALLCANGPPALLEHPRVQRWGAIYAAQLNAWQLYHARCTLDIAIAARRRGGPGTTVASAAGRRKPVSASRSFDSLHGSGVIGPLATLPGGVSMLLEPSGHVFARCAFCSHSLVTNAAHKGKVSGPITTPSLRRSTDQAGPIRPKATACPRCKKPLPRCAVCQQHLGCPDPDPLNAPTTRPVASPAEMPPEVRDSWDTTSSSFSHWMVWCQSCRHGGHAAHLLEWFEQHNECPVSGCKCRCAQLDRTEMRPPMNGDGRASPTALRVSSSTM
jgi:hypothetical protein